MTPRRARLVLVVLGVVGVGVWAGEPVYWWVMTVKVCSNISGEPPLGVRAIQ